MIGHVESALAARQASEMKVRHFVADASHELRTPLAAIRGYAELTRPQRADAPPQMAHAMERVESAAERMSTLVEDLLLLARLDTGRPSRPSRSTCPSWSSTRVSDAHAAAPTTPGGSTSRTSRSRSTATALQLHQVVANLLANARTHTAPGTVVSVSLRQIDANGGGVEVAVRDNGPGIPDELRPNVFERFARGDSSRSRAAGSSGLGPGHRVRPSSPPTTAGSPSPARPATPRSRSGCLRSNRQGSSQQAHSAPVRRLVP